MNMHPTKIKKCHQSYLLFSSYITYAPINNELVKTYKSTRVTKIVLAVPHKMTKNVLTLDILFLYSLFCIWPGFWYADNL